MKYLITGGSGYIGGRLTQVLLEREETELIVNVDVRPAPVMQARTDYVRGDVRDRAMLRSLLERHEVDALIHLAFMLNPIHDEARMYDIDVNGTQAVLEAAAEAGTGQLLVTSSATAYGAFPDNPVPIAEDQPVRGMPDFSYARDKAEIDRLCQLWAAEHPDRVMTIVRPCIVFGPKVDNYIVRTFDAPFLPLTEAADVPVQFVHEDDLVSALIGLLDARAAGVFNIGGDGTMTLRETAELIGIRTREMKFSSVYRLYRLLWALHLPSAEAPAGSLSMMRYPWVVSNEKLKAAVGWEPRYDSRQTFELTMRARGLLPAAGAQQAPAAVR